MQDALIGLDEPCLPPLFGDWPSSMLVVFTSLFRVMLSSGGDISYWTLILGYPTLVSMQHIEASF